MFILIMMRFEWLELNHSGGSAKTQEDDLILIILICIRDYGVW